MGLVAQITITKEMDAMINKARNLDPTLPSDTLNATREILIRALKERTANH